MYHKSVCDSCNMISIGICKTAVQTPMLRKILCSFQTKSNPRKEHGECSSCSSKGGPECRSNVLCNTERW